MNIHEFHRRFCETYDFLYQHHNNVAGYREAVEAFDEFVGEHSEFVAAFCNYRHDFISSDREAAAFMLTLYDMM